MLFRSVAGAPELPVAGPMARSARDLQLELEVLAGPMPVDARAYRWRLPAARRQRLRDYRIGFVLDDPYCPVGSDVKAALVRAVEALRPAGVTLVEGWPKGYSPSDAWETYLRLLASVMGADLPEAVLKPLRSAAGRPWEAFAKAWLEGIALTYKQWTALNGARLQARALWQGYFQTHDAFLSPVAFVPAFPHDHSASFAERTLATPEGPRTHIDGLKWIVPATLTGCPAVAAPVGRTAQGLPVGIQIMGPYLEDATPIDLAGRLVDVIGGFQPPPALA